MRSVQKWLTILVVACWPGASIGQEILKSDQGIEATIGSQIEAFLRDDFAEAFTFASPNIQGMFGTHERFGQMVRQGYPMVWRPGNVEYLDLRSERGALWQRVLIRDRQGRVHQGQVGRNTAGITSKTGTAGPVPHLAGTDSRSPARSA